MNSWMLLAGLLAAPVAAGQTAQEVGVRTFRFYRADNEQTLVTAYINIPYLLFQAAGSEGNGELKFGIAVQVTDSSGGKLYDAAWPGRAPAELKSAGGEKLEILDLSVPPGKYQIVVTVTDSVSGAQHTASAEFRGWSGPPSASDLMLSPAMRLVSGNDSSARIGEIRRGNTMVTAAYSLRLTPLRGKAYYLLEVYGSAADSAMMQVRVTDTTGKALVTTRPVRVALADGGSVLKGQLDLTGLPAGRYSLSVETMVGGKKEERSDQFVMADLESTLQREQARQAAGTGGGSEEAYFAGMTEAQLDEAEAPLTYLVSPDSLSIWKTGLSVDAKRRFLVRFWDGRNPTATQFYGLIAKANEDYSDGGKPKAPGWKSDRGRIFIKYGAPGDVLDRRTSGGSAPPYLVWRYSHGRERYYIFADRTGFGGYKLIGTNDMKEGGLPGYADLLGPQALQDISRWLGIDLFSSQPSGSVSPQ